MEDSTNLPRANDAQLTWKLSTEWSLPAWVRCRGGKAVQSLYEARPSAESPIPSLEPKQWDVWAGYGGSWWKTGQTARFKGQHQQHKVQLAVTSLGCHCKYCLTSSLMTGTVAYHTLNKFGYYTKLGRALEGRAAIQRQFQQARKISWQELQEVQRQMQNLPSGME